MRTFTRWVILVIAGVSTFSFIYLATYAVFFQSSFVKFKDSQNFVFDKFKWKPAVEKELDAQNSYGLFKLVDEDCEAPLVKSFEIDVETKDRWKKVMTTLPVQEAEWWSEVRYDKSTIEMEPKLLVHVVPHSHVDPGWLRTVNEYSMSTNKILTNMLNYLPQHSNMTFTWMETCFFNYWWVTLTEENKNLVRKLVKSGQLELTSGSWVMTDEASPYFWSSIDNIIEGHQFHKENFGVVPRVAWSNDPFGYGSTVPYLFRMSNVSFSIIHRIHTAMKVDFSKSRNMNFHFRQLWDRKGETSVFTHVLPYSHYDIPNTCGPSSSVCCQFDFKRLTHFSCGGPAPVAITGKNVAERSATLADQYRLMSQMYRHNVALIMLGDDFRFDEIEEWSQHHDNYAKLFEYINANSSFNMEVKFGTFSTFLNDLATRTKNFDKKEFANVAGDFFPYHDVSDHYWTGYYTTRPFFKRLDREVLAMIRAADISSSFAYLSKKRDLNWYKAMFEVLQEARRDLALFQHHDAITGTSKYHVVDDYGKRLHSALLTAALVTGQSVSSLVGYEHSTFDWIELKESFKYLTVPKVFVVEDGKPNYIWIYNPLPFSRREVIVARVNRVDVEVSKLDETPVIAQLNPIITTSGLVVTASFELLFEIEVPALAAVPYKIQNNGKSENAAKLASVQATKQFADNFPKSFFVDRLPTSISLSNENLMTYHNSTTGYLQVIQTRKDNFSAYIEFWQYNNTRSGAYLFTPAGPAVPWDHTVNFVVVLKGPLKEEVISITEGIYHRESVLKRILDSSDFSVNIENVVDVRNDKNTEIVMRFYTSVLNSNLSFYTDSNGLQMMSREYIRSQFVERNYYPIASSIVIADDRHRFSVLVGQPHGGTSPEVGVVEVMLDRILVQDDGKGLGYDSVIRDNVPAKSTFTILLEHTIPKNEIMSLTATAQRHFQTLLYNVVVFRQLNATIDSAAKDSAFIPIKSNFSCDYQLLNVRAFNVNDFGLILHRTHSDCGEDQKKVSWCGTANKGLNELLSYFGIKYKLKACTLSGIKDDGDSNDSNGVIKLKPMDIKTFCFSVDKFQN